MREHIPFQPIYEGTLGYARKEWIIKWKDRATELFGQDISKMTKTLAQETADWLNEKYPETKYWIEKG